MSGAEHLLLMVRVAAALLADFASTPGVCAIAWHPAGCASEPQWFSKAVRAWIEGGRFPALALSALERSGDGVFRSRGSEFLIGAESRLTGCSLFPCNEAARIGIRLTDWLVAHGRLDTAREVVLVGVGAVWLAPGDNRLIKAHRR